MPAYNYRAIHASGRTHTGHRQAANESELAQHLVLAGLELIDARPKTESRTASRWQKLAPRKLVAFCVQMTDMLIAGVPFIEALHEITQACEAGLLRDALTDILRDIRHGTRITNAFAAYAHLFPPVFIAILGAGEASGDLPRTFAQLTRYAESRAKTSEQMRRALRYPAFLMLVTLSVISFMMALVVPKVIAFLNTIDSQLPLMTKILIASSEIFAAVWWQALLALPIAGIALIFLRAQSERFALALDALLLRIPLFGEILRKLALARFADSFAILYQSGLGIPASLKNARATLNNRALEAMLDDAAQQVQVGQILSHALNGFLPPFALRMIRVGEHSSRLDKSLSDLAASYGREVSDVTERAIGMLEPALTLFIGAILAWTVLAVLGPIYGSLGKMNLSY